jgi:hypothetical protein
MKKSIFHLLVFASLMVLTTINSYAQITKVKAEITGVQVIQFHSEHRCVTCNKIESLTKETLKSFPAITFSLVNVDDEKNERQAEKFEATGTALFLYNPKTGKKKDLTDFAFMNAGNKNKFMEGLKKEINLFGI